MGEKENASLKTSSNPKKKRKPSLDNSFKELHNLSILHMGQFHSDFKHMKNQLKEQISRPNLVFRAHSYVSGRICTVYFGGHVLKLNLSSTKGRAFQKMKYLLFQHASRFFQ